MLANQLIDSEKLLHTSRATEHDIDQYTTGECHVFAVALHRLFGWPMYAVLDEGEPYWTDPSDPDNFIASVCHVYAIGPDGQAWDVMGVRKIDDVREEMESWCAIAEYASDHIWSEEDLAAYVGEWGEDSEGNLIDRPLHAYTDEDVREATEKAFRIFKRHPVFMAILEDERKPVLSRPSAR